MKVVMRAASAFMIVICLAMAAAAAEYKDTGKSLMWEVRSDAGSAYILGSLHCCNESTYPLDAAIEEAYEKSDTLVLEMDISMANQMKAVGLFTKAGIYPEGETLSSNLDKETLGKLKTYLGARGMQLAQLDRMKPWMALLTFTMQEITRLGYDPQKGIDLHFYEKATATGKPVVGLETVEEQVEIISGALEPIQEKELAEFVDEVDTLGEIYADMVAAWEAGDATAMKTIIDETFSDDPEVKEFTVKLIDERNVRMADRLVKLMNKGKKCFVVVGSGHVVTDESILALLEAKGYTVTQVEKKAAAAEAQEKMDEAPLGAGAASGALQGVTPDN
jgi:uncharacterized protein YbaP (TraB family)